jgi:dihydropteroate synthase
MSHAAVRASPRWSTTRFELPLDRPLVMAIVNLTPDSFSDGGHLGSVEAALARARQLLDEGADILDVGGESTRPGAVSPTPEEELTRVRPVLAELVRWGCPVSVDTSDPRVIDAALALGVDIVNDVRALRREGALQAVAAHGRCGLCLMHMQGEPRDMQQDPHYGDVAAEVIDFLRGRVQQALDAGIEPARLVLDPGFGFGKTLEHNLALAQALPKLRSELGRPLLVGWSRKGTLGRLTGRPVEQRLVASVAAALAAVAQGARVLRVHDVAATVDALKVWAALGPPGTNTEVAGAARDNPG